MKVKAQQTNFADVGVVEASKAIKKEKTKTKSKKDSGVLAAAQSPKKINGENSQFSKTENSTGTLQPVKRHKKKDAKRLARAQAAANNTTKTDKEPLATTQAKTEVEEKTEKKARAGSECTIFIGNLPPTTTEKLVRNLFKKYGPILAVRFRTNTGAYVVRKELKHATAINCYVRFARKEHMSKACEMDGHTVEQNRIRVTPQDVKPLGSVASTIFVGNLRAGTTDTELYDFFSTVGEIEYVRQIANRYVAYVCFKKGVSLKKAFKLDQQKLNNRPIRVQQVDPKITNIKRNKKGHLVKKNRLPTDQTTSKDGGTKPTKDFHGQVVNESAKKKKKKSLSKSAKAKRNISEKLKAAMNVGKK
ncbi:RNA-binding protein 34-like isoform X2 [Anopheles coustani]|uniref:RNA-binding protein 34-like isoform X2 n=1 Tax=Anopheles coustani TaxID=139045 RepID=UPI0026596E2A|nr:RNA-binding protein 34-like isoform X2 [Anopheles coustani]